MKKKVLCKSCILWCDCGVKCGKPNGFCLCRDLFTYTARTECGEYQKGEPFTEEEFDRYFDGKKD